MDEYLKAKHMLAGGMKLLPRDRHTDVLIHEGRVYRITVERLRGDAAIAAVGDLIKEKADE